MKNLTPRQAEILAFIKGHIDDHQRPPTIRAIRDFLGISSTHGVSCHLKLLEKKGVIRVEGGIARGILILSEATGQPEVPRPRTQTPESIALRQRLAQIRAEATRLERVIAALEGP